MNKILILASTLILSISFNKQLSAKISLPSFFTDHLVLQQKSKTAIWGWSAVGNEVLITTSWNGKRYKVITDTEGNWKVNVSTPKFGGPYEISISDADDSKVLKDILIGEVWLCSGQSNMEMPLAGWGKIVNYEAEIKAANFPNIRLLHVAHKASKLPLKNLPVNNGGWVVCSPTTIPNFSAVAYFFAREVYQKTGIPIGLINSSWGGTVAEAWISGNTLNSNQDFAQEVDSIVKSGQGEVGTTDAERLANWKTKMLQKDLGYSNGNFNWLAKNLEDSDWKTITMPGVWEKSVLPNFDGVVYLRTKVTIPDSWVGKSAILSLGTLDDQDVTYFDGVKIGETQTANLPRTYQLSAAQLTPGEHTIAIRVFDVGGLGGSTSDAKLLNITQGQETLSIAGTWKFKVGLDYKDIGPSPQVIQNVNKPTLLFNGMIHPLIPYHIKGVLWYQGESNAARAHQYRELFPSLVTDWRKRWNIGNFPFYFVQLANYRAVDVKPVSSDWAELRDAQLGTLKLPNTGMAVITDIGEAKDIHPKNKQDVGKRLALIALAKNYGAKDLAYSGPVFRKMTIVGSKATLSFTSVAGGLVVKDGTLKGFAIAGPDQKFYWAKTLIDGDKIVVSSPDVANPVAVRYNWAVNPEGRLYNSAGLPAGPFRTDNFKDSTEK